MGLGSTSEETRSMPAILSAKNMMNDMPPTHLVRVRVKVRVRAP